MTTIICPTVHHSGSHFVTDQLFPTLTRQPIRKGYIGPGIYFDHMVPGKRPQWAALVERGPVIIPLRPLADIARTWAGRGRDIGDLRAELVELVEYFDGLSPVYLPLTADDRDWWLSEAERRTGLSLDAGGWPKMGSHGKRAEPAGLGALQTEFGPFFERFF